MNYRDKSLHKHDWEQVMRKVPVHSSDGIRAFDVLKQRKCKTESCGKIETYDLQRIKLG